MPVEIRPGLWRWSAPHPEWSPHNEDGTPRDWPREVGCLLYETSGQAVFIDPQTPQAEASFWSWADGRCDGREVSVLETTAYHRRSRDQFLARYAASTSAPESVEAHPLPAFGETVYWLGEHHALVPGDVLIAGADGELRLCPDGWLDDLRPRPSLSDLREALAPAAGLGVELVVVSHGEPALHDGAALARVLRET